MTKKTALSAGAVVLLLAGGILIGRQQSNRNADAGDPALSARSGKSPSGGLAPVEEAGAATKSKPRDPAENPELVSRYGESRTNLSKHVANNVISLFEDGVQMGEMATSGEFGNAFGGPRAQLGRSLGGLHRQLNLTEEQQEKAATVLAGYQKREIVRSKETIERLKKDPTALMKLMLSSDAYARQEITEEEYKQAQLASGDDLKGVMNPLDRENLRGQPLKDEEFVRDFGAVLDPAQSETFQRELAEQESRDATGDGNGGIASMPSMELEKLDSTITAAKKFTTGLKSMMEGMGGLQDLGPIMEQQRKAREAREAAPAGN